MLPAMLHCEGRQLELGDSLSEWCRLRTRKPARTTFLIPLWLRMNGKLVEVNPQSPTRSTDMQHALVSVGWQQDMHASDPRLMPT